jgi:hypothetical protein
MPKSPMPRCLPLLLLQLLLQLRFSRLRNAADRPRSGRRNAIELVSTRGDWYEPSNLLVTVGEVTYQIPFPSMPVLRAQNLPRLKTLGRKRSFYVTVTDGARTWQTRSVQSVGNRVEWDENLDTLWVMSYFYFYLRLSLLQFCTTTLSCHNISLCETDYKERHPYWKAGDNL